MQHTCPRCGSSKIIPDVPLLDHYGDMGMQASTAEVKVSGNPQAWVFKDTAAGMLSADICGECGHAQLRVSNHRALYEKYLKAGGQG